MTVDSAPIELQFEHRFSSPHPQRLSDPVPFGVRVRYMLGQPLGLLPKWPRKRVIDAIAEIDSSLDFIEVERLYDTLAEVLTPWGVYCWFFGVPRFVNGSRHGETFGHVVRHPQTGATSTFGLLAAGRSDLCLQAAREYVTLVSS